MPRFYAADEVHAALDFARLADALARAFARGANVPLRHVHRLSGGDTLLLMPAWRDAPRADAVASTQSVDVPSSRVSGKERALDAGRATTQGTEVVSDNVGDKGFAFAAGASSTPEGEGALGIKLVTVMPGAVARGAATVAATYVLLDRATGAPRAVLDGDALTVRRTAAASALAARLLARDDADTLLIVGTGHLAPYLARAHYALRPALERVLVWGRSFDRARATAAALRAVGVPAEGTEALESAARAAHIISCATTSTTPLVMGEWLAPGTHLDLVGGFTRAMREVDDAAVARARIVVDTYEGALAEAGDLVVPLERGAIDRTQIVAELAELVRGERTGRTNASDITLFKSVGTALEDLAAAELVVSTTLSPAAPYR
ncbi:MAG TPA: ornithine cyclodeaminase family protein [Burkholderiaceae bacterium]|nr:ornithine cyclodeaminase family protein [Burkholderiaceae bacterium]